MPRHRVGDPGGRGTRPPPPENFEKVLKICLAYTDYKDYVKLFRRWRTQECSVKINKNTEKFSLGRYAPSHNILKNVGLQVSIVENVYSLVSRKYSLRYAPSPLASLPPPPLLPLSRPIYGIGKWIKAALTLSTCYCATSVMKKLHITGNCKIITSVHIQFVQCHCCIFFTPSPPPPPTYTNLFSLYISQTHAYKHAHITHTCYISISHTYTPLSLLSLTNTPFLSLSPPLSYIYTRTRTHLLSLSRLSYTHIYTHLFSLTHKHTHTQAWKS